MSVDVTLANLQTEVRRLSVTSCATQRLDSVVSRSFLSTIAYVQCVLHRLPLIPFTYPCPFPLYNPPTPPSLGRTFTLLRVHRTSCNRLYM